MRNMTAANARLRMRLLRFVCIALLMQDACGVWHVGAALARHRKGKNMHAFGRPQGAAIPIADAAGTASREAGSSSNNGSGQSATDYYANVKGLTRRTKAWLAQLRHDVATQRPKGAETYPFDALAQRAWAKYVAITRKYTRGRRASEPAVEAQPVRKDGSIFLSVASYRDRLGLDKGGVYQAAEGVGMCAASVIGAYRYAKRPALLHVGIVDQRCRNKCRTGVFKGGQREAGADRDCVREVCRHADTKRYCANGQIRFASLSETDAMGPEIARYLASQLWRGEEYFLQIDAHSVWADAWDEQMKAMEQAAPATWPGKAVITNYPPGAVMGDKTRGFQRAAGSRMCGSMFAAKTGGEGGIVRMSASMRWESLPPSAPLFAPFVAAGFFFCRSEFLKDVPFDPFLPWIFMGEEILLSARLFTSGWDIFSPTHDVIGHQYTVDGVPRFWETLGRVYGADGCHNQLQPLVLGRVKHIVGYPENAGPSNTQPSSLLTDVEHYNVGTIRPLSEYLQMAGVSYATRGFTAGPQWCRTGGVPPNIQKRKQVQQGGV